MIELMKFDMGGAPPQTHTRTLIKHTHNPPGGRGLDD